MLLPNLHFWRQLRQPAALLACLVFATPGCRSLAKPITPIFELHAVQPAPLSASRDSGSVNQAVWHTEDPTAHGTIQLIRAQSDDSVPEETAPGRVVNASAE